MMRYYLLEIKKILQERFFIIFMLLCLFLNICFCFAEFTARGITNNISTINNNLHGEKIFDSLNAESIGSYYYNERYMKSSVLNQWMKEKYDSLQSAIDTLNRENADISYFAGEYTNDVHEALFSFQMKALMLECIILITLICIRSFSIEQQNDMVSVIYSSKRGRNLSRDKIFANGIVCALFCVALTIVSLFIFFMKWNFSGLWDSNVSSSFHTVLDPNDPIYGKPFITWANFTLKEYFLVSLILMTGVLVAWWLISNVVALIVSNGAISSGMLLSMIVLPFFGMLLLPGHHFARMFYLNTLTISMVIYCNQWWLTDLGNYSLFAYQEVLTIVIHLFLGSMGILLGIRRFKKKELA